MSGSSLIEYRSTFPADACRNLFENVVAAVWRLNVTRPTRPPAAEALSSNNVPNAASDHPSRHVLNRVALGHVRPFLAVLVLLRSGHVALAGLVVHVALAFVRVGATQNVCWHVALGSHAGDGPGNVHKLFC